MKISFKIFVPEGGSLIKPLGNRVEAELYDVVPEGAGNGNSPGVYTSTDRTDDLIFKSSMKKFRSRYRTQYWVDTDILKHDAKAFNEYLSMSINQLRDKNLKSILD